MTLPPSGLEILTGDREKQGRRSLSRFPAGVWAGLWVLVVMAGLSFSGVRGQTEFTLVMETPVDQRIPPIENQLYGHGYVDQALSQRLGRIERTLFGAVQHGSSELRIRRIESQMREKKAQTELANQEPLLEYLEERFFQQSFKEKSLPDRMRQLELHVFGRAFDNVPLQARFKKLSYSVPLAAREIRVARGDTVLATTGYRPRYPKPSSPTVPEAVQLQLDAGSSRPPLKAIAPQLAAGGGGQPLVPETIQPQLDAGSSRPPLKAIASQLAVGGGGQPLVPETIQPQLDAGNSRHAPVKTIASQLEAGGGGHSPIKEIASQLAAGDGGQPLVPPEGLPLVMDDDYAQAIHREADGAFLRWRSLPIRVYVRSDNPSESALSAEVIRAWQSYFSVTPVSASMQADVIVAWNKDVWMQNSTGLLTRPVIQVDEQHRIRTVILISMYPLRNEAPQRQFHVLAHQMGHAFGLWGHSDDPGDVMYPAFQTEWKDYPASWAWRAVSLPTPSRTSGLAGEVDRPSRRDGNTLLKIYGLPARDLGSYSPY